MPRIHLTIPRFAWTCVEEDGPYLCNHASCIVKDKIYIHGGQTNIMKPGVKRCLWSFDLRKRDKNEYAQTNEENTSSNILRKYNEDDEEDISSSIIMETDFFDGVDKSGWRDITCKDTPMRSMHCLAAYHGSHILSIGGWTGQYRSVGVCAYDIEVGKWLQCRTIGFPEGAGLSSHSVLPMVDDSYLVMGREGSLRQQRRHGGAWFLTGSPRIGFSFRAAYFENPILSRSNHCLVACSRDAVTVVGGRKDRLLESHKLRTHKQSCSKISNKVNYCRLVTDLTSLPLPVGPRASDLLDRGRFSCAVFAGHGCLLIYGGMQIRNGIRAHKPCGDFLFYRPAKKHQKEVVCSLPIESRVQRSNMAFCTNPKNGVSYMHGGVTGADKAVCPQLFKLVAYEPNQSDVERYYDIFGNEKYIFTKSCEENRVFDRKYYPMKRGEDPATSEDVYSFSSFN